MKIRRVVRTLVDKIPFGSMLRDTFCSKFKIVKMHEKHTGKPHSFLYQADRVPSDYIITKEVADIYDVPQSKIVIDSITLYKRKKHEPIHKPDAESIKRNERFPSYSNRSSGDAFDKHRHSD